MIDFEAMGLMVGGTLIATALQAGWAGFRTTAGAVGGLLRPGFNMAQTKGELAQQIADLSRDGLVRARAKPIADAEFGTATSEMLRTRSIDALLSRHDAARSVRFANATTARQVCHQAAELSQMFGLAGTLLSLGRLGPLVDGASGVAGAIGMAVTTTLYGVILANLLFVPLAGMIDRRARAEDKDREDLFDWLQTHAQRAAPRLHEIGQNAPSARIVA